VSRLTSRTTRGLPLLLAGLVLIWCCAAAGDPMGSTPLPSASLPSAAGSAAVPATATPAAAHEPPAPVASTPTPTASAPPASPLIQDVTPPNPLRRFVVLGDSLSAWAFAPRSYTPSTAGVWPAVLDHMDADLVLVHNSAVPGNTTAQMAARLNHDVFAYDPDVLFVLGGTNDVGKDWPVATTVANLRAIVRAAKARGIDVVLLTIPPNNGIYRSELKRLVQTNVLLKRMAAQEGITVADDYAALVSSSGRLPNAYCARDHIHLTAHGEQALAQAVYRTLHPLLPDDF
jgi:lysophospholipase L1-like esterase